MSPAELIHLGEAVLNGHRLTPSEALALCQTAKENIPLAAAYANKIRHAYCGDGVDMCGLINARSGQCSEDCRFCAQSAHFAAKSPAYPLLSLPDIQVRAQQITAMGANRFSLVTSGKGMDNDPDFLPLLESIRTLSTQSPLGVCANLGTLLPQQAEALAAAGVKRYAHNLETSEKFYPQICTTHPYAERLATLRHAKTAGLELCSGGIIGMGESWQDRIDLAFALRELDPASVPINILHPIPGTPLGDAPALSPLEIILTFALFRFTLPRATIRPAGGRELNLRDLQGMLLLSGANGLIIGNYLTFSGRQATDDFQMVHDAGLYPNPIQQEAVCK